MATKKPLRDPAERKMGTWAEIHNQSVYDRIQYKFFQRYADELLDLKETKKEVSSFACYVSPDMENKGKVRIRSNSDIESKVDTSQTTMHSLMKPTESRSVPSLR